MNGQRRRCAVVGCPHDGSLGLAVGTVAGLTLEAPICRDHANEIEAMRQRLPTALRDWSGRIEWPP
jgi:hypothetical protein